MARKRRRGWDGGVVRKHVMKAGVWSKTPMDLQRRLLHFLPLPSLCRFKLVSKDWYSAIHNSPLTTQWYVSATFGLVRFYDGLSWKTLDLPPFSQKLNLFVSSSAGLMLACEGFRASEVRCMVFNPLVPSRVKELRLLKRPDVPDFDDHSVIFTGIQTRCNDEDNGKATFAIVCLTKSDRVMLHVYDSRTSGWVVTGDLPLRKDEVVYHGMSGYRKCMLLEDGVFYFVTRVTDGCSCLRSLKSVSIWDPKMTTQTLATWEDLPLNVMQPDWFVDNDPSLISCQGKLVLVNLTEKNEAIGFVCLDKERREWQAMASLPISLLPEKVQARAQEMNMKFQGMVGIVMAAGSSHSAKVALYYFDTEWGCIYDLEDGTWSSVNFPTGYGKGKFGADVFHPFQPSFLSF